MPLPIDVKTRMFPEQAPTLAFVAQLLQTGVSAVTIHCRTQSMRSREPALLDRLRDIVELARPTGIPVIANGDCVEASDHSRICGITGVNSIMIARGAESNPSCFRPAGRLDPITVIAPAYLKLAIATGNHFHNTKYTLGAMDPAASPSPAQKAVRGAFKLGINKAKTYEDACKVAGVDYEEASKLTVEELVPAWVARSRGDVPSAEVVADQAEETQPHAVDEKDKAGLEKMIDELPAVEKAEPLV